MILRSAAGALAAMLACIACGSRPTSEAPLPLATLDRPVIVGHGGAKDLCSENTLPCFQRAIDLGARALEADLQVLGDGSLVMFHDDDTRAQAGVDRPTISYTLAEFRRLDAGWGYTPDGGATHPERGLGIVSPTLDEFLAAFADVPVLLDVKPERPEMSEALLAFARDRLGERDRRRLYIKSNDTELPDLLRALDPPPIVALSEQERALLVGAPDRVAHLPPSWIDLPPVLLGFAVGFAREHGHFLTASTIDDEDEMASLLARGDLDGIVTNRPDLLRNLLNRN